MVRLRLRRVGRKKQPSYRLVAADRESPRDGKFLEIIGFYNPRTEPATIQFKEDRIYDWMSKGAQPSDSVDKLFKTIGLWERYERFKAGEDVEKLLEEAKVVVESRDVSGKTRHAPPKKKAEAKVEEPAVEEAVAEEAVAEEEAPEVVAEEPAAEEAVAEEEAVPEAEAEEPAAEEAVAEEEAAPEAEAEEPAAEEAVAEEEAAPEAEAEEPAAEEAVAEEEAAPEAEAEESAEEEQAEE